MTTRVCQTFSAAFEGLSPSLVAVQVQISSGLPMFTIVGLADRAVAESRERVRGALSALGMSLPASRVVVSLSPANLPKVGNHFDLAIALALLGAMGVVTDEALNNHIIAGELDLMGNICEVSGILPLALKAKQNNWGLICPAGNGSEALWAGTDVDIIAARGLNVLLQHLDGSSLIPRPVRIRGAEVVSNEPTLGHVRGQEMAKRAIVVAAAGGHNILLRGPPGVGKTMLARAMRNLLPPLRSHELLEVAAIYSLSGIDYHGIHHAQRPFRDPHHSASMPSLVGGGSRVIPGEVTLAHRGVLFLDELPEFAPKSLDAMRQPLESGCVTISRVHSHVTYPALFQMVAAMNPCRCVTGSGTDGECRKGEQCAQSYQSRISGPFLDRIDMIVDLEKVAISDLLSPKQEVQVDQETSHAKEKILNTHTIQSKRSENTLHNDTKNPQVSHKQIEKTIALDPKAQELLLNLNQHQLSGRGYYRVLRVARTIADLCSSVHVGVEHVREALVYRHRWSGRA